MNLFGRNASIQTIVCTALLVLSVIVFASIHLGHPFTESYARQSTPKAVWHTAEFHAVNRRISAMWELAFLVGTVSLFVAGSVDYRQVLLRVIIPFGALAWVAGSQPLDFNRGPKEQPKWWKPEHTVHLWDLTKGK